jgi:hypothetical protein
MEDIASSVKLDQTLINRLESGERVYLQREIFLYLLAGYITAVALFLLAALTDFILFYYSGSHFLFPLHEGPAKFYDFIIFLNLFLFSLFGAVFSWGQFRFVSLQFEGPNLKFWDWRNRLRQVDFAAIRAVSLRSKPGPGPKEWTVGLSYPAPETAAGVVWQRIFLTFRQVRALTIFVEIASRSQLIGDKIIDNWYSRQLIRFRPEQEYDFSPLPWWKF